MVLGRWPRGRGAGFEEGCQSRVRTDLVHLETVLEVSCEYYEAGMALVFQCPRKPHQLWTGHCTQKLERSIPDTQTQLAVCRLQSEGSPQMHCDKPPSRLHVNLLWEWQKCWCTDKLIRGVPLLSARCIPEVSVFATGNALEKEFCTHCISGFNKASKLPVQWLRLSKGASVASMPCDLLPDLIAMKLILKKKKWREDDKLTQRPFLLSQQNLRPCVSFLATDGVMHHGLVRT